MPSFDPGNVFYGGAYGFATQITTGGVLIGHVPMNDPNGNPLQVNGLSVSRSGKLYSARGAVGGGVDYDPHDVVALPDDSGYLGLIARTNNTLILRRYDTNGNQTGTWQLPVEFGWTPAKYAKLDVTCDGRYVYYSMRMKDIRVYDIVDNFWWGIFERLDEESPYIFADFQLLPPAVGGLVVNMTASGMGPRNAICLDSDGETLWTDEINPTDSSYEIWKRNVTTLADVMSHTATLNPGGVNDTVLSLASYYSVCPLANRRKHVHIAAY